ncbi:MAG: T9SS type A sorting domain-containing protein [Bacteroidetes bacterium]|nr:T9SS type A sorting domain-containing protein [Bacteroidota bacterium]
MKKAIILTVCSLWAALAFSQDYFPIIEEGKTWNVLAVTANYPYPWDTTFSTISYQLAGDTLINAVSYKKVYSSYEEIPVNWNLCNFMREDANKKVWIKETMADDEYLLYDFSINEGDSILVGNYEPVYLFVDSVTSVTVNETARQKYWMSCKAQPDYHETWIEGVGSNKGVVWSGSAFITGGWYWLLCVSENGALAYMNPYFNSCYFVATSIEETYKGELKAYPNPAKDYVVFELPANALGGGKNLTLQIHNLVGEMVHQERVHHHQGATSLSVSQWPSGMYIATIHSKGQVRGKCKVVVE